MKEIVHVPFRPFVGRSRLVDDWFNKSEREKIFLLIPNSEKRSERLIMFVDSSTQINFELNPSFDRIFLFETSQDPLQQIDEILTSTLGKFIHKSFYSPEKLIQEFFHTENSEPFAQLFSLDLDDSVKNVLLLKGENYGSLMDYFSERILDKLKELE